MPDSFPPLGWGPPPFDERDLDALLSGDTTDTPVALRQVADALAALRAAPTQAELTGEAVARAEFRALVLDEGARTDGLPYDQVLSALTLDGARRHPARHGGRPVRRRRRSSTRPLTRRGGILLGVAAAVVIVVVVAFNGSLSGPIQRLARSAANSASAKTGASAGSSNSGHADGSGSTVRASRKTPPRRSDHSASPGSRASHAQGPRHGQAQGKVQPRGLCTEYYGFYLHPRPAQSPDTWSAEVTLFGNLSKLAGGNLRVAPYCAQYVRNMFPPGTPWWTYLAPGNQGNGPPGAANTGSGGAHRTGPPAP
jgi:hypothetical protein